jgi:hypothetical protein
MILMGIVRVSLGASSCHQLPSSTLQAGPDQQLDSKDSDRADIQWHFLRCLGADVSNQPRFPFAKKTLKASEKSA